MNATLIVAGLLDNYYACLETVFLRISQFFENELSSDHWHADRLFAPRERIAAVELLRRQQHGSAERLPLRFR